MDFPVFNQHMRESAMAKKWLIKLDQQHIHKMWERKYFYSFSPKTIPYTWKYTNNIISLSTSYWPLMLSRALYVKVKQAALVVATAVMILRSERQSNNVNKFSVYFHSERSHWTDEFEPATFDWWFCELISDIKGTVPWFEHQHKPEDDT